MRPVLLFFFCFLLLPGFLAAADPSEEEMRKMADQLSLQGQMKEVQEKYQQRLEKEGGLPGLGGMDTAASGWTTTSIMLGLIWGSIGTGYFIYGKKAGRLFFVLSGMALCVFPMFVTDDLVNLIVGIVLTIAPFKIDF